MSKPNQEPGHSSSLVWRQGNPPAKPGNSLLAVRRPGSVLGVSFALHDPDARYQTHQRDGEDATFENRQVGAKSQHYTEGITQCCTQDGRSSQRPAGDSVGDYPNSQFRYVHGNIPLIN